MRQTKKKTFLFLAFVVLLAMFACIFVEPAMTAFHVDDHSAEMASDAHCVTSCHVLHHQALFSEFQTPLFELVLSGPATTSKEPFVLEEPVSSIFRPPLSI